MKIVKWTLLTVLTLLLGVAPGVAQPRSLRLSGEVTTWPGREKRFALLVGVNTYEDSQITPLVGAANDMVLLEEALVKYGGFDRDRVVRLTTDATEPTARPTRANILVRLSNVLKAVPADGLVVLAFSGHGIERENRAFLLPTDARVNDDIDVLESTALEVVSLRQRIENRRNSAGQTTGVAQVLVLLDACRNDPTSGKDTSANPLSKAYDFNLRNSNVQAFATIYATSRGERAYENRVRKHGYFIAEVVAGLSGAAANAQGEVTLQRLVSYLEDKVPTKVTLDLGHRQRPFMELKGYKAADLVISVNRDLASAPVSTPASPVVEPIPAPRPTVLTPVIPLPTGVKPTALTTLSFTTARVDSKGLVTKLPGTPTQQYEEDLGGGVKLEMVAIKGDGKVRDLWMGKHEVTQEQWQAVMGGNPSKFKGVRLPVESVSWEEVKEYCRRLNAKLGLTEADGYRLPTEAEWEYAARAGTTTAYAFGETISPEIVNYDGNYPDGNAPKGIYRARTVEVGSLGAANGWGLYDMHGNVWEWCEDEFRSAGAAVRVIRGGGWYYGAVNCRSALRYRAAPGDRAGSLGFRLSRTLP